MRTSLPSGTPVEVVKPDAPRRGVVVIPDIMGLRPLFDDLVVHLASTYGWAVAAVEPFPGRETMTLEERMSAMSGLDDHRQVADVVAAADLLELEPVAVLGFCMGGMYTMKAAGTGRFDRAAPFYGMIRVPEGWRGPAQRDALDLLTDAPGSAAKVLAIIGTNDPYTPARDVDDLEAAGATVVRYDGAEHGFVHDASRPAHRADDAADAWRRVADWFA
ncbi:MAG TPA: dienelactone hydrolase family protein [Acidimicrobiales bacterium]|nr:dienelactone hydrolase family protein [Acidimicrobiales bacterium]